MRYFRIISFTYLLSCLYLLPYDASTQERITKVRTFTLTGSSQIKHGMIALEYGAVAIRLAMIQLIYKMVSFFKRPVNWKYLKRRFQFWIVVHQRRMLK